MLSRSLRARGCVKTLMGQTAVKEIKLTSAVYSPKRRDAKLLLEEMAVAALAAAAPTGERAGASVSHPGGRGGYACWWGRRGCPLRRAWGAGMPGAVREQLGGDAGPGIPWPKCGYSRTRLRRSNSACLIKMSHGSKLLL